MKLLLIANDLNDQALEALCVTKLWLDERGIETESASSASLVFNHPVHDDLVARAATFDLVCAFGGDGTILRAARVVAGTEIPLLGFNYGNVGFLAGATAGSMLDALSAFFAGELVYEQRVMLIATVSYDDGSQATCRALNEIALARTDLGRSIGMNVTINGDHLFALRGDGAIVATATGSTAYALAAGGPLLAPGHRGLCVVPICPRPYATPAIVAASSDIIELTVQAQTDQYALISVDGQAFDPALAHIVSVRVEKAPVGITLVRYNTPDFYARLAAMFDEAYHAR